jgi:hypothetical protein
MRARSRWAAESPSLAGVAPRDLRSCRSEVVVVAAAMRQYSCYELARPVPRVSLCVAGQGTCGAAVSRWRCTGTHHGRGRAARSSASRCCARRAGGCDRDSVPQRSYHCSTGRASRRCAARSSPIGRPYANREYRQGIQWRSGAALGAGGPTGSGRHNRKAASRDDAGGLVGGHGARDAQSHQRIA